MVGQLKEKDIFFLLNTIEIDCKANGIDNELTIMLQLLFKRLNVFKENLMLIHID